MTYENVRLLSQNFTGDRTNSYFYTFQSGLLVKKNKTTGATVSSYPPNYSVGTVYSVQFDGVYYWSLERQTNGFLIRKWLIDSGILFQRAIYSFINDASTEYNAYSIAVDSYNSALASTGFVGAASVVVSDTSVFNIGDTIVLGPSSYSGFENKIEEKVVVSKDATRLYLDDNLLYYYQATDGVYTNRNFYVFNKYSPYCMERGALLRYNSHTGLLQSYHSSDIFADVRAACFYGGKVLFMVGNEVVFVNPVSLSLYSHMAVDNLGVDRATTLQAYGLWAYSNVLYRLQNEYVYYDSVESLWDSESWGSYYNYVTSSLLSAVYFIEVFVDPPVIHAVAPPAVLTSTSSITVIVLDQYRVPIPGKTVLLTTSTGSVTPSSGVTDSNGRLTATYNGTSAEVRVTIKAKVL